MYKTLLFALTLALSAACLQAQDQSQTATPSAGQAASSQTVEGCLQGSNGSFTLTDNTGATYQLSGDNPKLADHVGHQVQITGSTSAAGSPSAATPSSAGAASQTLTVEKVKMVSKTCKAAK